MVWALAQQREWLPAHEDPTVARAVADALQDQPDVVAHALTAGPPGEGVLRVGLTLVPGLDADRIEAVIGSLKSAMAAIEAQGLSAVLVCAPTLRPALRRLVSAQVNGVPVLSYQEATVSNIQIETVGVVRRDDALTA